MAAEFEPWGGVPISEETIQRWKNTAIQHLTNHPKEADFYIMSGDTMVVASRHCWGIDVFDTHIRRKASHKVEGF